MKKRLRRCAPVVDSLEGRLLLSAAPQFTVKDLGTAYDISAAKINNLGQVAGTLNSTGHAFLTDPNGGAIHDLGSSPDSSNTYSLAINDLGQITGSTSSGHAFLSDPNGGTLHYLTPETKGGAGVNNFGQVTGWMNVSGSSNPRAFFLDSNTGTLRDLGTLHESSPYANGSHGWAINDSGQVAGDVTFAVADRFGNTVGTSRAFLSDPNGGTLHDLGTLSGDVTEQSQARDVNNIGQVVGSSGSRAFLSDPNGGTLHEIELLPGFTGDIAMGINDSGEVVGYDSVGGPDPLHAFVYLDGTPYDLNNLIPSDSGFKFRTAIDVNNGGQILVNAAALNGTGSHYLLLTPIPPAPVAPTITWSNPADIVYGTPLSATQLDATSDVPGTFTYDVAEGTVLHAGAAQVIHATFTPDDLVHYTTATATASINVKKAWVSLTSQNGTKVYGADVPHLGVSYGPLYENGVEVGPGFVNGDTAANLTTQPTVIVTDRIGNPVTSASPVAPPNPPGVPDATTYYIVQAYGAYSPDYEFAYRSGQFRITPAPLTVTANNATKVYGAALPTLTASYSGFVNGDTAASLATQATATTSATTASPVGSYAITASGATDPNYAITYLDGTLTVTPAPLTVTANNAQVRYPFPIPRLTGTITGLVNGDTDVATYTTTAVQGSWAGYYPIIPHLTDPNYNITFVNGTLTIYWNVPPGGY